MRRLLSITLTLAAIFLAIPSISSAAIPTKWTSTYLTWYQSYPPPNSDECILYNGCQWEGYFAYVNGKQTQQWVKNHNIAAIYEKFGPEYKKMWLDVRWFNVNTRMWHQIKVQVLDVASDNDCIGCPGTPGSLVKKHGFFIDLEWYTANRLYKTTKPLTVTGQYRLSSVQKAPSSLLATTYK